MSDKTHGIVLSLQHNTNNGGYLIYNSRYHRWAPIVISIFIPTQEAGRHYSQCLSHRWQQLSVTKLSTQLGLMHLGQVWSVMYPSPAGYPWLYRLLLCHMPVFEMVTYCLQQYSFQWDTIPWMALCSWMVLKQNWLYLLLCCIMKPVWGRIHSLSSKIRAVRLWFPWPLKTFRENSPFQEISRKWAACDQQLGILRSQEVFGQPWLRLYNYNS